MGPRYVSDSGHCVIQKANIMITHMKTRKTTRKTTRMTTRMTNRNDTS